MLSSTPTMQLLVPAASVSNATAPKPAAAAAAAPTGAAKAKAKAKAKPTSKRDGSRRAVCVYVCVCARALLRRFDGHRSNDFVAAFGPTQVYLKTPFFFKGVKKNGRQIQQLLVLPEKI